MRLKLFAAMAAALLCPSDAAAAWHEATSRHFTIYSDQDPAELKAFAEDLERFNSAVRAARGTKDVEPGASSVVTLYVLKDIQAIQSLYGSSGVGGFYMPKAKGSVAFVPRKNDNSKWGLSSRAIFFHEYMHHLMLEDTDRPLPIWVSEGSAEFFATPRFEKDGSVTFGFAPLYREGVLRETGDLTLTKMLSGDFVMLTVPEFQSIYGRGWMLIHYLAFNQERRGQQTKYLDGIMAGTPPLQAAKDAFGDLIKLDSELEHYRRKKELPLTTVDSSKISIPPISIRRLSPGEVELIDERTRMERGGKRFDAKKAAAAARVVAAKFPADMRVQTQTAQIENAAENPKSALTAAEAALALDPTYFPALMARGHALAAIAKADPKTADWEAVRRAFGAANKRDPEAAEPLIEYYRTYVSQGVRPTAIAGEGLAYALALAPQDDLLRMEIVGHLIDDNRLPEAKKALIPLAYDPHVGKRRDASLAIFEALNAGDRALAKQRWDLAQEYFDPNR